eukprot:Skav234780  [mRNA]  locus=scaffold2396:605776:607581:- [translate_table: standard]
MKRAVELRADEKKLHDSLPSHLNHILKNKKLLLFKEMLIDLQYPDSKIVDEMIQGFPLTGWSTGSGVFDPRVRLPEVSVEQLRDSLPGLNRSLVASLQKAEWSELDQAAWNETQLELEKGWISVCDEVNLDNHFLGKRFPLEQKDKIRMIDDFSIGGLNLTVGLCERLRVESIEELVASVAVILNKSKGNKNLSLKGRTFDLKSAYKQLGVDEEHAEQVKIAVRKPSGGCAYYNVLALPFGATASVGAFLRVSSAITYLGRVGLRLVWTNFFDDYTAVCKTGQEESTAFFVESLFVLLGFAYAKDGPKAPPFESTFKTLGLEVSLDEVQQSKFCVGHTASRKKEFLDTLQHLMAAEKVATKDLERLHGRLVWFRSHIFGRIANHAVKTISSFSRNSSKHVVVTQELATALKLLQDELVRSEAVTVDMNNLEVWYVFTDGAFEPSSTHPGSIGGVLVNSHGRVVEYFGVHLPEALLQEFLANSKHPIYELEVFPLVVALRAWGSKIKGSRVIYYLDNDAARSAFVQGLGATPIAQSLVLDFLRKEKTYRTSGWFGRVPTASNIADSASRLDFEPVWFKHAERVPLVLPLHLSQWGISGCTEA